MRKLHCLNYAVLLLSLFAQAQKLPLDKNSYDGWKSLSSPSVSDDGNWIGYVINPQLGDGSLYIFNIKTGQKDSIARGSNLTYSPDLRYLVYQISPSYSETRQARKKKLKPDKMPKNDLEIRLLSDNQTTRISRVKSFALPEKNSYWMAYLLEKPASDKNNRNPLNDSTGISGVTDTKKTKTPAAKGSDFVIVNPVINKEYRYQDVTEYVLAKDGNTISFVQEIPDSTKIDNIRISVFETKGETSKIVFEGKGSVKKLSTHRIGNLVSFIYSADTAKEKIYDLWLSKNSSPALKIVDSHTPSMPSGWAVSENENLAFSDNAERVYFGTAPKPFKEPEDTLLDDEKYKLDIWSWNDDILQPMQKKQLDHEKKRSWMAVFNVEKNQMYQLADTAIPSVRVFQKGDNDIALGSSNLKYRKSMSWDGEQYEDYYIINIKTGTKSLVLEKISSHAFLSPTCKYLLFWDGNENGWISMPVNGGERKKLTSSIKVPLYDELNDVPASPSPHGIAGWMDDERHVLVYDRYDIWSLDLNGIENPVNITNNYGRINNLRFRYIKLDPDEESINRKNVLYLSAFNYDSKVSGFFTLKPGKQNDPVKLILDKASFPGNLIKAKKADILVMAEGNFYKLS